MKPKFKIDTLVRVTSGNTGVIESIKITKTGVFYALTSATQEMGDYVTESDIVAQYRAVTPRKKAVTTKTKTKKLKSVEAA